MFRKVYDKKNTDLTWFMELSATLLPWIVVLGTLVATYGLYRSFAAPPDYQQGDSVKIMFVHVPCAWMAMMAYLVAAGSGFFLLVFGTPIADVSAKAATPLGAVFTALALITGSLWGKPMWGTYWAWDARLTSVLLLFFLYLGLIVLRSSLEDETLAGKLCAVLSLVGVCLLPVIKFSVEWWNTLHQPSTGFTSTVHPSIRTPLLIMTASFVLIFFAMYLQAMRNEILRRKNEMLLHHQVQAARRREINTIDR